MHPVSSESVMHKILDSKINVVYLQYYAMGMTAVVHFVHWAGNVFQYIIMNSQEAKIQVP